METKKISNLSFMDGFTGTQAKKASALGNKMETFDWGMAALIIKERFAEHPDLMAEAGLQGDWEFTGGVIFEDGKPTNEHYTFLSSNWAIPTIILSWDGEEQQEIACCIEGDDSDSKWAKDSLNILEIQL